MATTYLAEIVVATDAAGTTSTLRYSTGSGFNAPDAPGYYEPRIIQPANFRRDIFEPGKTGGASRIGWGEMVLANADGELDALIDYGFDGRSMTLLIGDDGGAYADFDVVLVGTMEQPAFTWELVSVRIRDRQEEFDKPIQETKYAGTNSGSTGLEGLEADIKGRPKPQVYGLVYNVSPPAVNTSTLVYQVNDGAVQSVDAVYDRGAALTKGADYADEAAMLATAPSAGQFRAWPGGGYFRLGSSPAGQITADVTQGATTADRTAAQIAEAIVTGPGGLDVADVTAADITALDSANSGVIGIWIADETDIRSALDEVCGAVGAWWGFDRSGKFRVVRLEAPSGSPAVTLKSFASDATTANDGDILSLERAPTNDQGRGVPTYRVKLKYQRNWTPQASDVAGSVADARRAFLREEWREAVSTDAAVQDKHILAEEMEFQSLLADAVDAQDEADRLLALYKVRRDRLKVSVKFGAGIADTIDLGSVLKVEIPRFGYDAGKLFRVIGMQYDAASYILDLDLWG